MHVNKAKVTNCLTLSHLVCQVILLILFFRMYGDLHQVLLVVKTIMCVSLMITLNLFGYTCCATNLKSSNAFMTSKTLLNDSLVVRSVLSKQIGEESIKPYIPSLLT